MPENDLFQSDPYVVAHPRALPFWEASERDCLLLPRCTSCGNAHWYPRSFCPHCHAENIVWRKASGQGHIYASSALRWRGEQYIVAYITLEEGPVMLTNIVECSIEQAAIGEPVAVQFVRIGRGRKVPVFGLNSR
ncbi:OB-fold domain-containing protein [Alcaligenaceae bacterium]|nr:OB-fold domain-containing protein [Alcaligenaceae bacterium]